MAGEHAGRSLIEILWEQLDIQYANLMDLVEEGKTWTAKSLAEAFTDGMAKSDAKSAGEEVVKHLELKGKVAGLAYSIAKITNPYGEIGPAMDAIRKEARERWEAEFGNIDGEEEDDDADV